MRNMLTFHGRRSEPHLLVGCDILVNKLWITSYELLSLRVVFITPQVMSYELLLLHELRVTFLLKSYELLFTAQVTSFFLHTSYDCFLHELIFFIYFLIFFIIFTIGSFVTWKILRNIMLKHYETIKKVNTAVKGVLGNFPKFMGKHLCQSLFFIKLQASGVQLY